jgi:hypothetical protein
MFDSLLLLFQTIAHQTQRSAGGEENSGRYMEWYKDIEMETISKIKNSVP